MLLELVSCANQQKCQGPPTSLRTHLSTHPDQRGPLVAPVAPACSVSLPQELSPPTWRAGGKFQGGDTGGSAPAMPQGGLMDRTQVSSPLGQDNSETCPTHCPRGPQQNWGSETSSETCSLRHTVLTLFLPLSFPTSLLMFPEITPHKRLQLKYFYQDGLLEETVHRFSTWGLSQRHSSHFNREKSTFQKAHNIFSVYVTGPQWSHMSLPKCKVITKGMRWTRCT